MNGCVLAVDSEPSPVFALIVPVYNEAANINHLLQQLRPFFSNKKAQVIIVDGGSDDSTVQRLQHAFAKAPDACEFIQSSKGRAVQMNAGAAIANAELLVFLHADTVLPSVDFTEINDILDTKKQCWGRFNVDIQGRYRFFKVLSFFINWRSRLTGIATGDQCIFVKAQAFKHVKAYANQDLMEDIDISSKLKRLSSPLCLTQTVQTSGRRWEKHGLLPTIFLMWQLRFDYWRGVPANDLAKRYR